MQRALVVLANSASAYAVQQHASLQEFNDAALGHPKDESKYFEHDPLFVRVDFATAKRRISDVASPDIVDT